MHKKSNFFNSLKEKNLQNNSHIVFEIISKIHKHCCKIGNSQIISANNFGAILSIQGSSFWILYNHI